VPERVFLRVSFRMYILIKKCVKKLLLIDFSLDWF
jgi:hypothetical protein